MAPHGSDFRARKHWKNIDSHNRHYATRCLTDAILYCVTSQSNAAFVSFGHVVVGENNFLHNAVEMMNK